MYRRRLPRLRTVAIPVVGALTTLMVCASAAHAADITPTGIGDLMPSPQMDLPPAGSRTLYEQYWNPLLWQLDSDYGVTDVLDPALESTADICMALISAIGTAVVVIVQWLFNLVSIPELQKAITKAIGGAAKGLTETLLPSAIAVGGFIAFLNHRRASGSGLSQIGWVIVSGIVSVSLLTSPGVWVDGVDTGRQLGSNIAMNATANGIGEGQQDFPFSIGHQVKYGDNEHDNMLRKSSDAVWRTYVATPWCVAEFGSLEACKRYGKKLLDQGFFAPVRKVWLQDNVDDDDVGEESAQWRRGHNPIGRIMITAPALLSIVIFAAQVLILALSSLAALLGVLMLLVAGVLFACLWVIPGRPRQWGMRWFDQVLGFTLQSGIVTLVLGCTLILQSTITTLIPTLGYLPSAGLSIAAAVVAVRFRKILDSIVGVTGGGFGAGGAVLGMLAARAATKAASGLGNLFGGKRAPRTYTPPNRPGSSTPAPAPPPPTGGNGGGGPTFTGIPRRPKTPLPATSQPASLPAQREPVSALTSAPDTAPSVTITRPRSAEDGPPTRRSVPAGNTRTRTPLPAGTPTPAPLPPSTPPAELPPGRPSPTLRPEQGTRPNFAFRSAPRPGDPTPKLIEAKVIRSYPNTPSTGRPAGRPAGSPRPAAGPRRTRRAPKATRRGDR